MLYLPQELTRAEAIVRQGLGRPRSHRCRRTHRGGARRRSRTSHPLAVSRWTHRDEQPETALWRTGCSTPPTPTTRCVPWYASSPAALADGTPAHRVAVLYGAAKPYARLLHEHLGAAGLTVNGPGTRAVHERALARGFLAVLEACRRPTFPALRPSPPLPRRPPPTSSAAPSGGTLGAGLRLAGIVGGRRLEIQARHLRQTTNATSSPSRRQVPRTLARPRRSRTPRDRRRQGAERLRRRPPRPTRRRRRLTTGATSASGLSSCSTTSTAHQAHC